MSQTRIVLLTPDSQSASFAIHISCGVVVASIIRTVILVARLVLFGESVRIILSIWLLMLPSVAIAEWVKVSQSSSGVTYVDATSIRAEGSLRRAWILQDLRTRDPYGELSRRSWREYDCPGTRFRMLSITNYSGPMATGKILISGDSSREPWNSIGAESVGAEILKFLCARSGGTRH